MGLNDDPNDATEDDVETFRYAMHNANYNVIGLVDETGAMVERYEYTPYGERQVYISAGLNDPDCYAPIKKSKRVQVAGIDQPWGVNPVGHQGLFHDEETELINNRRRMRSPQFSWLQREPLGYIDGMNLYQYVRSNPEYWADPSGAQAVAFPSFWPWIEWIGNTIDLPNPTYDGVLDSPKWLPAGWEYDDEYLDSSQNTPLGDSIHGPSENIKCESWFDVTLTRSWIEAAGSEHERITSQTIFPGDTSIKYDKQIYKITKLDVYVDLAFHVERCTCEDGEFKWIPQPGSPTIYKDQRIRVEIYRFPRLKPGSLPLQLQTQLT